MFSNTFDYLLNTTTWIYEAFEKENAHDIIFVWPFIYALGFFVVLSLIYISMTYLHTRDKNNTISDDKEENVTVQQHDTNKIYEEQQYTPFVISNSNTPPPSPQMTSYYGPILMELPLEDYDRESNRNYELNYSLHQEETELPKEMDLPEEGISDSVIYTISEDFICKLKKITDRVLGITDSSRYKTRAIKLYRAYAPILSQNDNDLLKSAAIDSKGKENSINLIKNYCSNVVELFKTVLKNVEEKNITEDDVNIVTTYLKR